MAWQSPYVYDNRFREITNGYYICVDHSYRGSIPGPDCDHRMCAEQEIFFENVLEPTASKHTARSLGVLAERVFYEHVVRPSQP